MNYILLNKKILTRNESDLYWLLKRMTEADSVNTKDTKPIIEFGNDNM